VSDGLLEAFRHNAWANRELLTVCKGLSPEQLGATTAGTYGSVLATLQHILDAEAGYRTVLSGRAPSWADEVEQVSDLDELGGYAEEMAVYWEELVGSGFDGDMPVRWFSQRRKAEVEARADVLTTQTINHGNEHRSQICTVFTTIGMEPPALDGWAYAVAVGHVKTVPER